MNNNYLVGYIRDRKNKKRGVIVGAKVTQDSKDIAVIGYSLCKTNSDVYNRDRGIKIAAGRLLKSIESNTFNMSDVPQSIEHDLLGFAERCTRYFKTEYTSMDNYSVKKV